MTPEQFNTFLIENEKSTGKAVEKYVNGHLREIREEMKSHIEKHDAFMKDVEPILETYHGGKVLGELVKWIAGVGLAILAIKGILWK